MAEKKVTRTKKSKPKSKIFFLFGANDQVVEGLMRRLLIPTSKESRAIRKELGILDAEVTVLVHGSARPSRMDALAQIELVDKPVILIAGKLSDFEDEDIKLFGTGVWIHPKESLFHIDQLNAEPKLTFQDAEKIKDDCQEAFEKSFSDTLILR